MFVCLGVLQDRPPSLVEHNVSHCRLSRVGPEAASGPHCVGLVPDRLDHPAGREGAEVGFQQVMALQLLDQDAGMVAVGADYRVDSEAMPRRVEHDDLGRAGRVGTAVQVGVVLVLGAHSEVAIGFIYISGPLLRTEGCLQLP